jgi:hypothetical protein
MRRQRRMLLTQRELYRLLMLQLPMSLLLLNQRGMQLLLQPRRSFFQHKCVYILKFTPEFADHLLTIASAVLSSKTEHS